LACAAIPDAFELRFSVKTRKAACAAFCFLLSPPILPIQVRSLGKFLGFFIAFGMNCLSPKSGCAGA
jgi:hypothetical protein